MICFSESSRRVRELLDERYAILKPIEVSTLKQMRTSVNRFEKFLGRPAMIEDLERLKLARFTKWVESEGGAPATASSKRRDMLSLARFAAEEGLIDAPPGKVPRPKIPDRVPDAWTAEQMQLILAAARRHRHGAQIEAMIRVCWDTCCRVSAVYGARRESFDAVRGVAYLYESKKFKEFPYALTPATVAALAKLPPLRKRLCGDAPMKKRWRWLDEILVEAGLPTSRRDKFQKFRRSKYTAVSVRYGRAEAARHAGHTTEAMAKFYDDLSLHPAQPVVNELALGELTP
jgi:integrase